MTRKPFFAANWKMHKTPAQASEYVSLFWAAAEAMVPRVDIALCAPFVDLETLRVELEPSSVKLGAQDCYYESEGAFTGEISVSMLAALDVSYCIIGHSERRRLFGETDEAVARKVAALLGASITPIVCVGESLEEKKQGWTAERISAQVRADLGNLNPDERAQTVIAYEPIWAIGSGLADDPQSANATIAMIRGVLDGLVGARILYGGSMNASNAAAFCAQPEIDGGLVGSASLDARAFLQLIKSTLA